MIIKKLVCREDAEDYELAQVKQHLQRYGAILASHEGIFVATFDSGIEYVSFLAESSFASLAESQEFGLAGSHNTRRI